MKKMGEMKKGGQVNNLERRIAEKAAEIVRMAGEEITFSEYDKAMFNVRYFIPLNWCIGWGLSAIQQKANHDKLFAFKACQLGLIEQTAIGYKSIGKGK